MLGESLNVLSSSATFTHEVSGRLVEYSELPACARMRPLTDKSSAPDIDPKTKHSSLVQGIRLPPHLYFCLFSQSCLS